MIATLIALALQSATVPATAATGDPSAAAAPRIEPSGAATEAARQWLGLVDAGDYVQSWQTAGAAFRGSVSQDQWTQQLPDVRRPYGTIVNRHPQDGEEVPTPPANAPDGQYRVIRFSSDFSARKGLVETVVTDLEDGGWRVVGYFIADPSTDDSSGTSPPDSTRR